MVRTHSQHQCSSIPGFVTSPSSACAIMSFSGADEISAANATTESPTAFADGHRDELDAGAAETAGHEAADGNEAAGAEAAAIPVEPTAASSSGAALPVPIAAVRGTAQSMLDEIQALKAKQKEARDAKKKISKDLRNAERRRQRLKKRAKALSDSDLLAVMTLRQHEKALGRKDNVEVAAEGSELSDSDEESGGTGSGGGSAGAVASPAKAKKKARST